MDLNNFIKYFMDGPTDTMLLMVLVLIDTVLGLSQAIKNNKKVVSRTLLTGIVTNVLLSIVPIIIYSIPLLRSSADSVFLSFLSAGYTMILGYGVIQSILANLSLLGIKLPDKLLKWLSDELIDKENKNKRDGGNNDEETGN